MSNPWGSLFEIFMAKYVPCLDYNLKDADLITILQSDLYIGAQNNLCFKFVIALEDNKVFTVDQQHRDEGPRFQMKSTLASYTITNEVFPNLFTRSPFVGCFSYCIMDHQLEYELDSNVDDLVDMLPPNG
jgi:hypothetical protein